ncbi:hypothetical protein PG994_005127 [Apiospora phragmitis]|uniref:Uncharacterized protein n=1 Tax=Apiospora phragmitis TaxID=2905665 RepID=A0ABR1VSL4_9PEZI
MGIKFKTRSLRFINNEAKQIKANFKGGFDTIHGNSKDNERIRQGRAPRCPPQKVPLLRHYKPQSTLDSSSSASSSSPSRSQSASYSRSPSIEEAESEIESVPALSQSRSDEESDDADCITVRPRARQYRLPLMPGGDYGGEIYTEPYPSPSPPKDTRSSPAKTLREMKLQTLIERKQARERKSRSLGWA